MNNGLGLRRWKYLASNGYANLLGKEWGAISSTSMSNIHCHLEGGNVGIVYGLGNAQIHYN